MLHVFRHDDGVPSNIPPPRAFGDADSEHCSGDGEAAAPEVATSMQQGPLLRLHDGAKDDPIEGAQIMDALGDFLSRYLPRVDESDPYRAALVALASASGCPRRALQVQLEAL